MNRFFGICLEMVDLIFLIDYPSHLPCEIPVRDKFLAGWINSPSIELPIKGRGKKLFLEYAG
jgi:hypothetical protein